jgi:hypothetical protein
MELDDKAFLLRRQASVLEARVEVVHPPEAAALARPVEACMSMSIHIEREAKYCEVKTEGVYSDRMVRVAVELIAGLICLKDYI